MKEAYINILKREVIPALGCTEPIALALATAKCRQALGGIPERITVLVSGNILKNGMGVGIPGTGMVGLNIAAALGAIGGNPDAGLEVLKDATKEDIEKAKVYLADDKIKVELTTAPEKLYIEVIGYIGEDSSSVIIKNKHNNIVLITKNGNVLFEIKDVNSSITDSVNHDEDLCVKSIYEFIKTVPYQEIEFLMAGIEMNRKVSDSGRNDDYGLKTGKTILNNKNNRVFSDSLQTYAMGITAAGVDARMDGCTLPVMSTAGSGNQGLTATLPVIAVAEKLKLSDDTLVRAIALSDLITIHVKSFIGRLSALCGCGVAASIGASCAMVYMLGGDLEAINKTIKNMVADVSGMVCDGAKPGCALKISTAVGTAVLCAALAVDGIEVSSNDGIVHEDVERTIRNMADLGVIGMADADRVILNLMMCK
ncbi:MAG: L-serine ammonia-lyase, iron-sulfur-dependent, subunit alpha [Clostridium sp.]|uniref:L-cysteine desulfidase family protein n=1 Tax=Clostridium sp. TaxID=1506 RepID=UPI0030387BEF